MARANTERAIANGAAAARAAATAEAAPAPLEAAAWAAAASSLEGAVARRKRQRSALGARTWRLVQARGARLRAIQPVLFSSEPGLMLFSRG